MSNVAFLHFKVGSTDGVSLEIEKWKLILEKMGHKVFLCAGDLGSAKGVRIAEMYHHTPESERLYLNSFQSLSDFEDNQSYENALLSLSDKIEKKLGDFIENYEIDCVIPNNILSVGANPAAAIAVTNVIRKYGLRTIAHHHDFYFERFDGLTLTCPKAIELADKYLPPHDEVIKHVVINKIAQKELKERKGIDSSVIPNVFDFEQESWQKEDYNRDLREKIGLKPNDIFILQAVRLVPRKGIELAIDLVAELERPDRREKLEQMGLYDGRKFGRDCRIVLVLAGYAEDDLTGKYLKTLKEKIKETDIDAVFISDKIRGSRTIEDGDKKYSLWDAYVFADLVIYSSLWEGWGNQLLEAVFARLPTVIYEYSVYLTDIVDKNFRFISLGSKHIQNSDGLATIDPVNIDKAADSVVNYLVDKKLRKQDTEHNYAIGMKNYSYQSLQRYLEKLDL